MDYKYKNLVHYDDRKYERIRWILAMFNKYEDYYRNEIMRMITNQRMYWGVNFGQWPAYAVEKLISQGRRPPTFNIIGKKIESQIGSYLSNGFDMKYETRSGKDSHWSLDLMDMMFADKSRCDWKTSEIVALRDMHCMVGYERMFITDRFDADFGNIAWEPLPPTHIYLDPSWKSPNAFDIENYFEWGEYSVAQICALWPKIAEHIREIKEREETEGINFGEYAGGPQRYRTSEEKWADFHRVITFHSVVKEEREWEYDLVNRIPFPETGYEPGTPEDQAIKAEYMMRMGISQEQVTKITQRRRVKRIEVICPTLHNELFLASGKDRIQTNNCNLYPIGNNFYGQYKGVVDDLYDVQIQFNKGKMTVEDIQRRAAHGAFVLDRALAGGDEGKRVQIEAEWNNPAARIWVDEGSTAELGTHGGIIKLPSESPTPDLFRVNAENLDLADWLSTMPAAMDARTESSSESGKLYQSKYQVGLISQKFGMEIYERHKREKAQAYPLQSKITYAGYPRDFRRVNGKDVLVINQAAKDSAGRRLMINDISVMPEMNVIVTPSPAGTNLRTELRNEYNSALEYVSQDPNDRILKLLYLQGLFNTREMSEEERESQKRAIEMLLGIEAMKLGLTYDQLKQQMDKLAQAQQMKQQAQAQPQSQPQTVSEGQFDEDIAAAATPQDEQNQVTQKGATV